LRDFIVDLTAISLLGYVASEYTVHLIDFRDA